MIEGTPDPGDRRDDGYAVRPFLEALALLTGSVAERLEETSGGIAEALSPGSSETDHLIVRFQDFDRLQQEITALAAALAAFARSVPPQERLARPDSVLSEIRLSDLRRRLIGMLE